MPDAPPAGFILGGVLQAYIAILNCSAGAA
jgi:hypothetical protein